MTTVSDGLPGYPLPYAFPLAQHEMGHYVVARATGFRTGDVSLTVITVSDALGTATEMRAMKNYAGHRLSPWLGHLMVSRQETARPLLTPGEVMQLPPDDELVLVSGCHPIRAKKARYYEDGELKARILSPPKPSKPGERATVGGRPTPPHADDWVGAFVAEPTASATDDPANAGIRREPELPKHEEVASEPAKPVREFEPVDDEPDDDAQRQRALQRIARTITRQVTLDPADDMGM
jgi:type IV secretion system protein VirD4